MRGPEGGPAYNKYPPGNINYKDLGTMRNTLTNNLREAQSIEHPVHAQVFLQMSNLMLPRS